MSDIASATPRPWARDKYGQARGPNGKEVQFYSAGVSLVLGGPNDEAVANTALMYEAVNSYDALLARAEKAEADSEVLLDDIARTNDMMVEAKAQRDALATANKQVSNMLRGGAMAQRDAGQHHTSTMFLAWAALLDEAAVAPESPAGRQLDHADE